MGDHGHDPAMVKSKENEANLFVCVYVIWVQMAEINISLKFWLDSWSHEYKFMGSLQ